MGFTATKSPFWYFDCFHSQYNVNIESRGLYSQGLGGGYIEDDGSAEIAGVLIDISEDIVYIKNINYI